MSGEVDMDAAMKRATEIADEAVRNSYWPQDRQSMEAHLLWARTYARQLRAMTESDIPPPTPKTS